MQPIVFETRSEKIYFPLFHHSIRLPAYKGTTLWEKGFIFTSAHRITDKQASVFWGRFSSFFKGIHTNQLQFKHTAMAFQSLLTNWD